MLRRTKSEFDPLQPSSLQRRRWRLTGVELPFMVFRSAPKGEHTVVGVSAGELTHY